MGFKRTSTGLPRVRAPIFSQNVLAIQLEFLVGNLMSYILNKSVCFSVRTLVCFAFCWMASLEARATIVVTASSNANSLASALTALGGPGIVVTSATLINRTLTSGAISSGTYSANGATYGLSGTGIVLSSGNVLDYGSGVNSNSQFTTEYNAFASAAQNTLLTPITGQANHFDFTELSITFNTLAGFDRLFVDVVYGSEEFPEFVNSTFIDPFAVFLNNANIAISGGQPVTSRNPGFASIAGTELDGVLAPGGNPIVTFSANVGAGTTGNTLRFVIADTSDDGLDSTAYISALGGRSSLPVIPEPNSLAIWVLGTVSYFGMRRPSKR